jgi:hypothetical protein
LHAACCKVAHLSGAGEYIDELDQDLEVYWWAIVIRKGLFKKLIGGLRQKIKPMIPSIFVRQIANL